MTLTIDCQTCPARGRHCGDCFVPVLGRAWAEEDARGRRAAGAPPANGSRPAEALALDASEEAAVRTLLRGGLVSEAEARRATARAEPGGASMRLHAAG